MIRDPEDSSGPHVSSLETSGPSFARRRIEDRPDASRKVVDTELVWSGKVFGMRTDQVELAQGVKPVVRDYMDHPGAVGIVALRPSPTDEAQVEVLLVRQYRHAVRKQLWEIPAGLFDIPGEAPLEAAKRELREEADLVAHDWQPLVTLYTSPGASNESLTLLLAQDLEVCEEAFDRTEEEAEMVSEWIPLDHAVELVLGGKLSNPSAVTGILAAHARLTLDRQQP